MCAPIPRDSARTTPARSGTRWPSTATENYTDDGRYAVCQASAETRGEIWAAVADAGTDALEMPRRLADAWDSTRKQREYLNARDEGYDAIYYAHAYKY